MNRLFFLIALVGFVSAVLVHAGAIAGLHVQEIGSLWMIHIGIFIVFFPFAHQVNKRNDQQEIQPFGDLFQVVPKKAMAIGGIFFLYALINFFIFMNQSMGGTPSIQDGQYILENGGRFIKNLSKIEYQELKLNEVRGFSGHWLLFYYLPMIYFLFKSQKQSKNQAY